MKFFDKLSKSIDNLDKKVNEKLDAQMDKLDKWNDEDSNVQIEESSVRGKSGKESFTQFIHLMNGENYPSFEEYQLALKDFFFDNSPEARNFIISKRFSIGVRKGLEARRGRNPLIELFIDDVNQRFIFIDFRSKRECNFYHFNQIIDFKYDEGRSLNIARMDDIVHMNVNIQLNSLGSSLSIPFIIDPDNKSFLGLSSSNPYYIQQRGNVDEILAALAYMKNAAKSEAAAHSQSASSTPASAVSAADEILKLKSLLDAGILTQEEFDHKKRVLLGM